MRMFHCAQFNLCSFATADISVFKVTPDNSVDYRISFIFLELVDISSDLK